MSKMYFFAVAEANDKLGVRLQLTVTFLPLLKRVGLAGSYGLYTVAAVISLVFVWIAVRETKGKTLEEM